MIEDDAELLRRYARERAEDAFAELVRRHVNLVYSVALRQLNGDVHLASDATQLVFTDLARKASSLVHHRVLAGWLFTSARFAAAKLVRSEQRRHAREEEASLMQELSPTDPAANVDWQHVRPVLDEAIAELNAADREAILLRFYEGRDYASVGAELRLSDNTARMRVERALEKLRALLARRGVTSTSAALSAALAHQAVSAVPAGLATAITCAALSAGGPGAVVAGSAAAAAGGFMSITKLQLGLSGALAVAGATGFVVQANSNAHLRDEIAELRNAPASLAAAQAENHRLSRVEAEVAGMRRDDAQFEALQQEAGVLRTRLQQLAKEEKARGAAPAQVFDIRQLDQTPVPRFQARPQYPFEMRRSGLSGEVVVDFVVDANGEVQNAYAARSSRPEFEAAAVAAVSKWKFRPGRKGGRDVATRMQVPIVFTLNEGSTSGSLKVIDGTAPAK